MTPDETPPLQRVVQITPPTAETLRHLDEIAAAEKALLTEGRDRMLASTDAWRTQAQQKDTNE
jgi:hypothetical protein